MKSKTFWNDRKVSGDNLPIWETLTLKQLEEEYSPSSVIGGDYMPFIQSYLDLSEHSRLKHDIKILKYGEKIRNIIEFSIPKINKMKEKPPLLVFIHGGYWQELSIRESFFSASKFLKEGIGFASIDYTLAPEASLDEIVKECISAVQFLNNNSHQLGFNNKKIIIAGSSAGAHLASMCSFSEKLDDFKPLATILVSGIFDLRPITKTSVNNAIGMTNEDAIKNSPFFRSLNNFPSSLIVWGENETKEFKRQSKSFANKLFKNFIPVKSLEIKNRNHFDVILDLFNITKPLIKKIL